MKSGITSEHVAHDLCSDLIPDQRVLGDDVVDCGPVTSERTDYAK